MLSECDCPPEKGQIHTMYTCMEVIKNFYVFFFELVISGEIIKYTCLTFCDVSIVNLTFFVQKMVF